MAIERDEGRGRKKEREGRREKGKGGENREGASVLEAPQFRKEDITVLRDGGRGATKDSERGQLCLE